MTEIYHSQKTTGVDTNAASKTAGVDVSNCDQVTIYVNGVTGVHNNHVITVQFSHENVNSSYQNSLHTIAGTGCLQITDIKSVYWMRLLVTTVEGALSTCDLCVDPSRERKRFC